MNSLANSTNKCFQSSHKKVIIMPPNFNRSEDHHHDHDYDSSVSSLTNVTSMQTELSLKERTVSSILWNDTAKRNFKTKTFNHDKRRTPKRRGRSNLSQTEEVSLPKPGSVRSSVSNKTLERIKLLKETTGRSVSSTSWLDNFDSKCSQKSEEFNGSTRSRRRRKLLICLSQVNRVISSKSLRFNRINSTNSQKSSTAFLRSEINRKSSSIPTNINNKKKVEWYNMEIALMRDGDLKIVDGWIKPVLSSLDEQVSLSENALKMDDALKVDGFITKNDRRRSVKKFMKNKLDNEEAMQYESMDNGAFSLWSWGGGKIEKKNEEANKESLFKNNANEEGLANNTYIMFV